MRGLKYQEKETETLEEQNSFEKKIDLDLNILMKTGLIVLKIKQSFYQLVEVMDFQFLAKIL
jgi:hypothetical protein|tara:strand:- start:1565 stop:1750 length:186 start_codon:yes stop_codon:yes gene_type:complete